MIHFKSSARFLILAAALCPPSAAQPEDPFSAADAAIQQAIAEHQIPGAVLLVGHAGKIVHLRAFGLRVLEPRPEPMTLDTIFDIASLTKPFTATCVMRLVERGQVRLNDPVARYLPEFARNGKQEITVRQLLTHFSGLPPDLDLKSPWNGREQA
ncbi:MAG: serine hydrolase domain-containing protein, partial [Terriglobales bacterium]